MKAHENQRYSICVNFDRTNATYKPEQLVTGTIGLSCKASSAFKVDISRLTIHPQGILKTHPRHNHKRLQQISASLGTIVLFDAGSIQLAKNKTINESSAVGFRFRLSKGEHKFLETYVGVYITIIYEIEVKVKLFTHDIHLEEMVPFYVQVPKQGVDTIDKFEYPKKKKFMIKSEDLHNNCVPSFKAKGEIDSQICYFSDDLNGHIVIDQADSAIRQIDIQMYRIERVNPGIGEPVVERTEIQMIQICNGNVTKNLQIPIYMILPRYYSCPSFKYKWAQVDFDIDLLIIFQDGFKITVNIPLKIIRS